MFFFSSCLSELLFFLSDVHHISQKSFKAKIFWTKQNHFKQKYCFACLVFNHYPFKCFKYVYKKSAACVFIRDTTSNPSSKNIRYPFSYISTCDIWFNLFVVFPSPRGKVFKKWQYECFINHTKILFPYSGY